MTFLKALALRAIRTAAQAAVGSIGATAAVLSDVNWGIVASTSGFAAIMSALMAVAYGLPEAEKK